MQVTAKVTVLAGFLPTGFTWSHEGLQRVFFPLWALPLVFNLLKELGLDSWTFGLGTLDFWTLWMDWKGHFNLG